MIPNVALGKAHQRHITRIVFPGLYEEGSKDRSIPTATLATIYDRAIRPAVQQVCPSRLSHWPPSYNAALNNARDTRGQLHFGTVDLPPDVIPQFTTCLKSSLDRIPKLNNAYFMHEIRGTKGATVHDPAEEEDRWETLQRELDFLDFEMMKLDDWYIDVGLEVHLLNHVLQWLEDAHPRLVRFALPEQAEINPASLQRLMSERKNFFTDRVAQFKEFAGFRCTTGRKGTADRVAYLNVYTTDKEPTYQLHTGSFRRHQASELLPLGNATQKLINDVNNMSTVFGQCMGTEGRAPNEGCARFEMRVELRQTPHVLGGMPYDLLSNSLVAIPVDLWWSVDRNNFIQY
jgi:hypothetical protein